MPSRIKIWREKKTGKQHGMRCSWEEDWYRISEPLADQKWVVIMEGLVDDSFIQHNSLDYRNFIEENGERKDER